MTRSVYADHFRTSLRKSSDVVLHSAELYPPRFDRLRTITWDATEKWVTHDARLQSSARTHPWHRYMAWATADGWWSRWRRERIVDPLLYLRDSVHWLNFIGSEEVGQLDTGSPQFTYELQEYLIPANRVDEFLEKAAAIVGRYRITGLNLSMRHSEGDPGTVLAWARGETFAVRVYHKQRIRDAAHSQVPIWTRELIDASIACGGCYFLPYRLHATREQFLAAYPRAREFFALKARIDPGYRFRSAMWDAYYRPDPTSDAQMELTLAAGVRAEPPRPAATMPPLPVQRVSNFKRIFGDPAWHDAFFRHLQNVHRLFPEDRLHALIKRLAEQHPDDETVYRHLLTGLPKIRPLFAEARTALPALRRHKRQMATLVGQVMTALGRDRQVDGYLEFGTLGRYLAVIDRQVGVRGPRYVLNDEAPGHGVVDVLERGRLLRNADYLPLNEYEPLPAGAVPDGSLDMVNCLIGLHHAPLDRLDEFVESLSRTLRHDGVLLLREYDAHEAIQRSFASLTHTVYNACIGVPWEHELRERRFFAGHAWWVELMARHGLVDAGLRIQDPLDPSGNTLMAFVKGAQPPTPVLAEQPQTAGLIEGIGSRRELATEWR